MKSKALWCGVGLGVVAVALAGMGLLGPWLAPSNAIILAEDVKARFSGSA